MENKIDLNKISNIYILSLHLMQLFGVEVEIIIFALPEAQRTLLVDNCRWEGCIIRVENVLHV